MKIEQEIKFDFSDVLIRPKRSTLSSRNEVELERTFVFKNKNGEIKKEWTGIPIVAANMDTTGTIEMYKVLSTYKMITCLHKFYNIEDLQKVNLDPNFYAISTGITDTDYDKLKILIEKLNPTFICIDVANGYMFSFVEFVKKVSENYPKLVIICGNVVSREMVEELIINAGADIIKTGIGGGCFTEDTKVLMSDGTYRNINEVKVNEYVINKYGKPVKVLNVIDQGKKEVLKITTNNWHKDIFVTDNHEYWVSKNSNDYKWVNIGSDNIGNILMPNNIKWDLPRDLSLQSLDSGYNLGNLFSIYLLNGSSISDNVSNICSWFFESHETDKAYIIKHYIKELFGCECSVSIVDKCDTLKSNKTLTIICKNEYLYNLFFCFETCNGKKLPNKFYCLDKDYIKGLFDGLVNSKNKDLINSNEYIIELFNWCCINLNIPFNSAKCKESIYYNVKTEKFQQEYTDNYINYKLLSKEQSLHTKNTWDIEVECPTHSFIANNSIVHNSVCTTRSQTGVGMPQLSCIMECTDAAHGVNGNIMSDGGCVVPGDISKAFGANADFVMLGGMLAGHTESGGELIEEYGEFFKMFYGMSSKKAMNIHSGGMAKHRSSEGKVVKIPYKGDVKDTIENILGGIRSTCTYIGAKTLKDMPKCTTFVRVNNQINNSLSKYND